MKQRIFNWLDKWAMESCNEESMTTFDAVVGAMDDLFIATHLFEDVVFYKNFLNNDIIE